MPFPLCPKCNSPLKKIVNPSTGRIYYVCKCTQNSEKKEAQTDINLLSSVFKIPPKFGDGIF